MSDKDLIRRGDVKAYKQSFVSGVGICDILVSAVTVADIDAIPAFEPPMSARELLLTENRMISQDDYAYGDYSALVWQMKIDEAVAFAQKWAKEHPETDMMTAKYALPRIDFKEGSDK